MNGARLAPVIGLFYGLEMDYRSQTIYCLPSPQLSNGFFPPLPKSLPTSPTLSSCYDHCIEGDPLRDARHACEWFRAPLSAFTWRELAEVQGLRGSHEFDSQNAKGIIQNLPVLDGGIHAHRNKILLIRGGRDGLNAGSVDKIFCSTIK